MSRMYRLTPCCLQLYSKVSETTTFLDLPCLPKRMKVSKCQKHVCNLCDNKSYDANIKAVRLALDYGMILKKVHSVTI